MIGAVAVVAGIAAVISGAEGQLDGQMAGASVESEYRFFAALWIGFGLAALAIARQDAPDAAMLRGLMGIMFLAGVARAIAWIDDGRPHDLFIALMALELLIPPAVIVWRGRLGDDAG